jgi:2-methylisocitrate lyase-like PEP mutase family enzyme
MIFAAGLGYTRRVPSVHAAVKVPVLANITEFARPVVHRRRVGIGRRRTRALSASAFRAMSRAAEKVYGTIRTQARRRPR